MNAVKKDMSWLKLAVRTEEQNCSHQCPLQASACIHDEALALEIYGLIYVVSSNSNNLRRVIWEDVVTIYCFMSYRFTNL